MSDAPFLDPALLRRYREMRGWTQTDLAYHAGCHQPQISAYEGGLRQPRPERRERLIKTLGIPAHELADALSVEAERAEMKEAA